MTRTFEHFLRSFSDEDLVAFSEERARAQPPYWRALAVALRVEAGRRGLHLDEDPLRSSAAGVEPPPPHNGTA